jgi:hypothetical protein
MSPGSLTVAMPEAGDFVESLEPYIQTSFVALCFPLSSEACAKYEISTVFTYSEHRFSIS